MRTLYKTSEGKLIQASGADSPVIVFVNPDETEKRELSEKFNIDEHTLLSALDPEEPSRFETGSGHLAFIFKLPRNYSEKDRFLFKVSSMGLFLYPDRLIIVLPEEEPIFTDRMFGRVESPQDVLLNTLLGSVHQYLAHLKVINRISDEIEAKISVSMENRYLLNLFSLEKSLVYYLNAIDSDSLVLDKLKAVAGKANFSEKNLELLDDIIIENAQCRRQAEIYAEVLATLMDARVSIVNNNLNILMKTLNFVTISIMVPTLVVSVFSMNLVLPYQHHPKAFWFVLALGAASLTGVMIWWKRVLSHGSHQL